VHCCVCLMRAFRYRYVMNHQYQCRRKLVHLDAAMCAEISNTADGSKCLREPLSASTRDSKISHSLVPRPSHKAVKSSSRSFQIPGISELSCDDTGGCGEVELTEVGLSDSVVVSESVQPQFSVDFVSAKQYMNPTFNLLNNNVPQKNVVSPEKHTSMLLGKAARKPHTKHVATAQKNSLDRYFKPVHTCKTNSTLSHTAGSVEHTGDCSSTPENSPRKSVMLSPIAKLPGSDGIYYSSPESNSRASQESITSDHWSSSARGAPVSESHHGCASSLVLNNDDDDLDFEASFDYIWKTNPRAKRKSAKQTSFPSKKASVTRVSRTDSKSFDSGLVPKDLTVASALQQNNAVSSDMSAENYGLFGFSNNTLLALDSDTDFEEEDATDYFSILPPEVVSNILCRLPFSDLCLNVNRVCLSWKNIIESDEVSHLWFVGCLHIMDFVIYVHEILYEFDYRYRYHIISVYYC